MACSLAYVIERSLHAKRLRASSTFAALACALVVCVCAVCGAATNQECTVFGSLVPGGASPFAPTLAHAVESEDKLDKPDSKATVMFDGAVSQQDVFARVTDEGALQVSESSTVDFETPTLCFRADIGGLPSETVYEVEAVAVGVDPTAREASKGASDDASGNASAEGAFTQLPEVPFEVKWRDGVAADCPDRPCWSFDAVRNHVYVFGNFTGIQRIEVSYAARFAVQRYADSSELFWHVKGTGDPTVSNLDVYVTLPVAQDAPRIELGVNSHAWLHGPEGSQAKRVSDDCVEYLFPEVLQGQFAEVRLLFPAQWLDGADREAANVHRDIWHRDQALHDEHEWSNGMRRWAMNDAARTAVALGFGCVVLCWGLVSFARFLRNGKGEADEALAASASSSASAASATSAMPATSDASATSATLTASTTSVTYWQVRKHGLVGMAGAFLAAAVVCCLLLGNWTTLWVTVGALVLLFILAQFVRRF